MPPHPPPVEPGDDDKWSPDDPTERTPRQRTAEERAEFDDNQRRLYRAMSALAEQINRNLRNPWRSN